MVFVYACCDTHMDDLECGRVSRLRGNIVDDFLHLLRGEHCGERQISPNGDDAIESGGTAQWSLRGPHGCYPDRNARRLERARQKLGFLDMISTPFVVVRLTAPKAHEYLKPLIQAGGQCFGIRGFAQCLKVEVASTRSHTKDQPSLGEMIQ